MLTQAVCSLVHFARRDLSPRGRVNTYLWRRFFFFFLLNPDSPSEKSLALSSWPACEKAAINIIRRGIRSVPPLMKAAGGASARPLINLANGPRRYVFSRVGGGGGGGGGSGRKEERNRTLYMFGNWFRPRNRRETTIIRQRGGKIEFSRMRYCGSSILFSSSSSFG